MLFYIFQLIILFLIFYCIFFDWKKTVRKLNSLFKVTKRDLIGSQILICIQFFLIKYRLFNYSLIDLFHFTCFKHPNKICFEFENKKLTFKELDIYSNKVANCFLKLCFKPGDEVSILMKNSLEFIGLWLGLVKIGIVPAFINTNQKEYALEHAIFCINSSALIFNNDFIETINDILNNLNTKKQIKYLNLSSKFDDSLNTKSLDLTRLIEESSSNPPNYKSSFTDKLFYIYTSGTTGMPKASIIRHFRFIYGAIGAYYSIGFKSNDVIYSPLPMYHSAVGIISIGQTLVNGITVVFKTKFSASQFWSDCIKYECTVVQYIGELCRYLILQPKNSNENQHKIRLMFGNGLRKNYWKPIKQRFGIQKIVELFASTEGNANLVNFYDKEGSCGFLPMIIPRFLVQRFYPLHLIKYNKDIDNVIRDENGYCIPCVPGEIGMLISLIGKKDPIKTFDGYTNKEETLKKIISNVFVKGDSAFISGDILYLDEDQNVYFTDRIGDTFRWKGENVSTTEVENIISSLIDYKECVVIGVELPGHEGRAGMLVLENSNAEINLDELLEKMKKKLPLYSIPIFIRIAKELDYTSTFKIQKIKLKNEAFNINLVKDYIYILNSKKSNYKLLDEQTYEDILQCNVRF